MIIKIKLSKIIIGDYTCKCLPTPWWHCPPAKDRSQSRCESWSRAPWRLLLQQSSKYILFCVLSIIIILFIFRTEQMCGWIPSSLKMVIAIFNYIHSTIFNYFQLYSIISTLSSEDHWTRKNILSFPIPSQSLKYDDGNFENDDDAFCAGIAWCSGLLAGRTLQRKCQTPWKLLLFGKFQFHSIFQLYGDNDLQCNGVRLHYASIPIEKLHKGILVKRSPQSPFSQCIIFSQKIFGI